MSNTKNKRKLKLFIEKIEEVRKKEEKQQTTKK